jgi:SAM-dependent methyltransferase
LSARADESRDFPTRSPIAATPEAVRARRTRRHPRATQFDYLHLRRLVDDLQAAIRRTTEATVSDVLDIYCGSRPYDDLLPPGVRCVGLDVEGNPYGLADVVSNEFLPFADASFDLVTCYEAFHYVEDPVHGVHEIGRVLRPGGSVIISVPFVWEYDRTIVEHRYTGPELAALFEGWDDVLVIENGGRVVAWATLTGSILERGRARVPPVTGLRHAARAAFSLLYLGLNGLASVLDALERRSAHGPLTLPMNLLLTARKPADG